MDSIIQSSTFKASNHSNDCRETTPIEIALMHFKNKEYEHALKICCPLAKDGNKQARAVLTAALKDGGNKIIGSFKQASLHGFAAASHALGEMYYFGEEAGYCVANNVEEAEYYFKRGQDHGYTESSYKLGRMYYEDTEVPKNYVKAFNYFLKACAAAHPQATFNVGFMYLYAQGVERNIEAAIVHFVEADRLGISQARAELFGIERGQLFEV